MASKRITYGDIYGLFESEGFIGREVGQRYFYFEKPNTRAALVLPLQKRTTTAAVLHVELARRTMIDFEIMEPEQFDRWLADPKHFQIV